jgi:hypothetical protein
MGTGNELNRLKGGLVMEIGWWGARGSGVLEGGGKRKVGQVGN